MKQASYLPTMAVGGRDLRLLAGSVGALCHGFLSFLEKPRGRSLGRFAQLLQGMVRFVRSLAERR